MDFHRWLQEQKRVNADQEPLAVNEAGRPATAELELNTTVVTNIVNNETFVTELTENNEFITNIVNNETFVTELVENNTYVTNVTQQINANINGKKGVALELATLDEDGKLTESQIPDSMLENPMTSVGEMIIGSGGTPVGGYTDLLAGLSGSGSGGVALSTNAGAGGWSSGWTNNTPSVGSGGPTVGNGVYIAVDFGTAVNIGRFSFTHDQWGNNAPSDIALQSSTNGSTWVTRWQQSVDGPAPTLFNDSGTGYTFADYASWTNIVIPVPVNARFWRMAGVGFNGFGNPWTIGDFKLDSVTVEGAGNPIALTAPGARRVLGYNPNTQVPYWIPPAAANADTSGATLVQLETEVNELKALLRTIGLLSS